MKSQAQRYQEVHEILDASRGMPHLISFEYDTAADGSQYVRLYVDGHYVLSHYSDYVTDTSYQAMNDWLNVEYEDLLRHRMKGIQIENTLEGLDIHIEPLGAYYHGMDAYILTDSRTRSE